MADLRISDLPAPVMAAKADWLVASTWIGFTPVSEKGDAPEKCAATINRQARDGYVLEYITLQFGKPNSGFEADLTYQEERAAHRKSAGRLVAVHRLRPSARPLRAIMGDAGFERMQDMWAENGARRRWSVAFPIIESYEITTAPRANEVFPVAVMQRLFAHPSATLRPLNDEERGLIADLPLRRRASASAWIAIEDEIAMAERLPAPDRIVRRINEDLSNSAVEGMTTERWAKIRMRAAWVANKFVLERQRKGKLLCDDCGFDPVERLKGLPLKPRSLLDVHHLHPLDEGIRRTTTSDFALLCPTCHRLTHALARLT
jgi:5-methylcytosine-specific restriction protein A